MCEVKENYSGYLLETLPAVTLSTFIQQKVKEKHLKHNVCTLLLWILHIDVQESVTQLLKEDSGIYKFPLILLSGFNPTTNQSW